MSRSTRRGTGRRKRPGDISFSRPELRDLVVAWLALSVAFAILFSGGGPGAIAALSSDPTSFALVFVASLATAGLGFVLHELAHKVVAVRYGQIAEFRADYGMLFIAVAASLAGFIFAAPGAVHHRGRITARQNGIIALAGPATNVVLGALFVVPFVAGAAWGSRGLVLVGVYGTAINLLLAGFNMLPFGPLDGATVRRWSGFVYLATAVPAILLGVLGFLLIGLA